MVIKQGILVSVLGVFLFTGALSASETKQGYEIQSKSSVGSPAVLPNEFAGELRTNEINTAKISERRAVNKVDLTKAMIGKFRINGI